ncbi:homocitrate synthase NifV [Desulfohalotomaculum tongense]|uniref:homocitrate synthase n=1 Tax=Desulforadius tongensis TaxID=1216062 RepID=UPI00195A70CB|nr:homocitrate synthase [Desulforadius tongensis]MBM7854303.1 homocitrate synthase NifV [Desulforadius tongensis]
MQEVYIVDSTLRDGEQAPGVVFDFREKVTIAKLLDRLGVYQIEAGIPVMGEVEQAAIKTIADLGLKSRVSTWNRLLLADIRASLGCGVKDLHISAPVSDIHIYYKLVKSRRWVLDCLKRALRYAADYGCRVTVGAEDASRADESFLLEFALLAQEMGAERLRYCDTVGVLTPFSLSRVIGRLKETLTIEIEFHGHNDFGLATANSLTAVKEGVRYIDTTIGGLGERAGNTCLEELAGALKGTCGIDLGLNGRVLRALSRYVARGANRPLISG